MTTLSPKVSVVVCTHNPREDFLNSTIEALKQQTLPLTQWELLLVDNLSTTPVSGRFDLEWHPYGRHLREEKIGLSNARICGIQAARGDLIVFVDDDNLLAPDYLVNALQIDAERSFMGVWGGHIEGRFEGEPSAWVRSFAHHLAVRSCLKPVWASYIDDHNVPYGAGMCVRSEVGRAYVAKAETDALCTKLDRIGKGFGAAGDHDICHTAQDMGLAIGRFPSLRMTHIIPINRTQPDYFLKLARGNSRSALLLALARNSAAPYRKTRLWPIMKLLRSRILRRGMECQILCAQALGELDALREMSRIQFAESVASI
jgi:glycosyltransferase involved in cell wall biosynthesis